MRRVDDTFFIHRWIRRPGYSLSRAITSSDDMTSAYSAPSMANVSSCTVEASQRVPPGPVTGTAVVASDGRMMLYPSALPARTVASMLLWITTPVSTMRFAFIPFSVASKWVPMNAQFSFLMMTASPSIGATSCLMPFQGP